MQQEIQELLAIPGIPAQLVTPVQRAILVIQEPQVQQEIPGLLD